MAKNKPTQNAPKQKPQKENESAITPQLKKSAIETLSKYPIVQAALQRIGIPKATYYKWRQTDPEFARMADDALLEGRSAINDVAESKLIKKIHAEETASIFFWLKNNHPQYSSKVSLDVRHEFADLDPEQAKEIANAMLRMGLGNTIKVHNFMTKEYLERERQEKIRATKSIDTVPEHYPETDEEIEEYVEKKYPSNPNLNRKRDGVNIADFMDKRKKPPLE